jgi:hypothetical protein
MTRCFAILTTLFIAVTALADAPKKPVFITQEQIDIAARETVKHPPRTFTFDFGDVVYENHYGRARFNYLPFLRTLPYTYPARNWNAFPPDPFVLAGARY